MRHSALILLLLVAVIGYVLYRTMSHEPAVPAGEATLQMTVEDFTTGAATLHNIKIDAQFSPAFSEYPKDLATLLTHKLRAITIENIRLPYESGAANMNGITIEFNPRKESEKWQGEWKLAGLTLEKPPYPLPPLAGGGTVVADEKTVTLAGKVQDEKATHFITFSAHYPVAGVDSAFVQFTGGQLPFEGGIVKLEEGRLVLAGKERFKGVLAAENIPLSSLLERLMKGKVTATGSVSGKVPVIIRDSGTPVISNAVLAANGEGVISLQPGALPAGNEQLALVSGVLSNFHYKNLSVTLSSDEKEELAATLALEGANPDLYNGRAIKLNVHLTGDLLSLVRHSVLTIRDPKQFLKQDSR